MIMNNYGLTILKLKVLVQEQQEQIFYSLRCDRTTDREQACGLRLATLFQHGKITTQAMKVEIERSGHAALQKNHHRARC